ncbi:MAG: PEP-CTERM/exosortase system-associated acyltransferase [Pseudomonadota bacterium]
MIINRKLADQYQQYFKVVNAQSQEMREAAYQLRYQVYCQEFGYERGEDFPKHRERDEFDDQSYHCLLIHKPTGTAIGYLRLIVGDKSNGSLHMPIEIHCSQSIDQEKFSLRNLDKNTAGEFSRFVVLSKFRRRKGDERKPYNFRDRQDEREKMQVQRRIAYPIIPLSLSVAGFALIRQSALDYGLAMMEPRMAYMLKRYGIIFKRIGDLVDYHGRRAPYLLLQEETLSRLSPEIDGLLGVIGDELKGGEQPSAHLSEPSPNACRLVQ